MILYEKDFTLRQSLVDRNNENKITNNLLESTHFAIASIQYLQCKRAFLSDTPDLSNI